MINGHFAMKIEECVMGKKDIETFHPAGRQEWRLWLQDNHCSKQSIWLVYYK